MTHRDLSWDEAMRLAAVDGPQLAERLNPRLTQHERYEGWLRRWRWWVEDETGTAVAYGRALTEKAATRRKCRAYLRELNR